MTTAVFMVLLEVCCTGIESALNMLQEGAHRVELCSVLECGGLTPAWLSRLRERPSRDLLSHAHVLIRCRPGDFCYSQAEVDEMCRSIRLCREIGVKGVVIGALTPTGDPDLATLRKMIHVAIGQSDSQYTTYSEHVLTLVFHRAFDECRDPFTALEQIISMGFNTLLTSGQAPTAEQGIPLLKKLVEQAAGRINIMAGKGVTLDNVARIVRETGVPAVHLSEREGIFKLLRQIQNANS